MLTRPNTARPLRIVIDPSALAHNLSRLRHARGGRPPRVWAVAKADAYGHGQAHLLAALAEADGLAVRDVAEAWRVTDLGWRGRILVLGGLFDRHEAGHLPACRSTWWSAPWTSWTGLPRPAPRGRRPSGCAGRATWAMPASMPATIPTPIAAPRRWPPGTRIGGRPSAALRERRGSRQALSVRPRLRPGDRRPARPGQPQQLGRVADSGRGAPTEDWIRPGLALYGASPCRRPTAPRSACGR